MEKINYLRLIKISGEDASSFLQGQLSNDIEQLGQNWQWQGYCSPKGRLIALMLAWKVDANHFFLIDAEIEEQISKRLKMYVLRSKVIVESLNDLGIFSQSSHGSHIHALEIKDKQHVLNFNDHQLVVDFSGNLQAEAGNSFWDYYIESGFPYIDQTTYEQYVPQMVNLDLLKGINFKKGCYTGQEIVARMHYLGNLKQRMFLLSGSKETKQGERKLKSGISLFNSDSKKLGTLLAAGKENNKALAVLRKSEVVLGDTLVTESGIELTIAEEQPYDLES